MSRETKNLIVFFAATFALTWTCYFAIVLSGHSPYQMPWMLLLLLGGGAPSLVGIMMAIFTYDRQERREYWRRSFSPRRIRWSWWLVIFLVPALLMLLSIAVNRALGGEAPGMEQLKSLIANPVMWPLAIVIAFFSGPFAEEFGWRGYSLEPLLKRLGVIPASIVLGIIWCVWHLPMFWMPDTWRGQIGWGLYGFWMNLIYTIGLTGVMTWVYLNTKRSILSGMLMHFTSNFTSNLAHPASGQLLFINACLWFVMGAVVCLYLEQRRRIQVPPIAESGQAA
jgi:membrane protease YdiL (CAAX protease family)